MKLMVDSRESQETKDKFLELEKQHDDLEVEICALNPGDFRWEYGIVEHKELDDFVSSFTQDTEGYQRLNSQIARMLKTGKEIMMFLIIGENFKDIYSRVHPHAVNGKIAKLVALGFDVVMMDKYNPWEDFIYRQMKMSKKYIEDYSF